MNLSKLIKRVHNDKRVHDLRLRQNEVEVVVKVLIEHIVDALFEYGKVKMTGLFTLDIRKAKGRKIRNPHTKEIMYSKDYYKVGLEPSKRIREGLEELRDEE